MYTADEIMINVPMRDSVFGAEWKKTKSLTVANTISEVVD